MDAERRCPNCGALVAPDAGWCGQCYARLEPPEGAPRPRPEVETPGGGHVTVEDGQPTWDCAVCGERNPIAETYCTTCGAPFARLFEEPKPPIQMPPQTAAAWSLLWPGVGHWKLGRRGDAVARVVLFAWAFGALLVLLFARFGKGGLGPVVPLFLLFLGTTLVLYVVSAYDAYRIAAGDEPLVSSRTLLWGTVGVIVASMVVAFVVALSAARG